MPPDERRWHVAEWAIDGALLGLFMLSACAFGALLWHPASPTRAVLGTGLGARVPMGIAMGITAWALVHSPWGRRSGAQMNPSFSLTFAALGRMAWRDLAGYVAAQFAGGALGVLVAWLLLGDLLAHPDVAWVTTKPGPAGPLVAFLAELLLSAALVAIVLETASHPRWERRTGTIVSACVALWIVVEAPLSGMSLNPARTLASAIGARDWTALWVYFLAPTLGMMGAAAVHVLRRGTASLPCGKLAHAEPCLFCAHVARGAAAAAVPEARTP